MASQLQHLARQSTAQSPPRLTVPALDAIENPSVETHPVRLLEWIRHLPYATPAKAAEALFESLFRLNRFPGAVPQRQALMDCYQPPFETLYKLARKASNRRAVQTARRQQTDIAALVLKITTELAYGYKRVINEALQGGGPPKDKEQFGNAIHAALQAMTLELMLEYASFIPDSKKAWREIFQLYSLAEQQDLQHHAPESGDSIELLFKRILLIALTDPYHLQRGEAWSCYDYLTEWGAKAGIGRAATAPENTTGVFLIDLGAMQPPKPPEPGESLAQERHRLLTVAPLNASVHRHLQQIREEDAAAPKGAENLSIAEMEQMFRHMLLAWHVRPSRRSPRHEKYGACRVACGLSAINHFLLAGEFTPEREERAAPPGTEDLILEEKGTFRREAAHYDVHRWRIFNRSASGIGMMVSPPFPKDLQVGQLVLVEIETEQREKRLTPGIVRRMIERDANTLETGIQFIHNKVDPIAIRPHAYGSENAADFQSGLLLNRGGDAPNALLVPHGMYKQRREFTLEHNGRSYRILAAKLIESTPVFDRFEYQEIIQRQS